MKKKLIAILCAVAMLIPMAALPASAAATYTLSNWINKSTPANTDYSFVVLGDTQMWSYLDADKEVRDTVKSQFGYDFGTVNKTTYWSDAMNWITSNDKVKYVFGVGDTVETLSSYPKIAESTQTYPYCSEIRNAIEWKYAKAAFNTLYENNIPFSIARGNHDNEIGYKYTVDGQEIQGTGYHENIATEQYQAMMDGFFYDPNSTAILGNSMSNSYKKIDIALANGKTEKYLMLTLDYNVYENTTLREKLVAWANNVIATNPDRKVIATIHAYLNADSENGLAKLSTSNSGFLKGSISSANQSNVTTAFDFDGKYFWDNIFSKHSNMFMVLCGHDSINTPVVNTRTGDKGNSVIELIVDTSLYELNETDNGGTSKGENSTNGGVVYHDNLMVVLNFDADGKKLDIECLSPSRLKKINDRTLTDQTTPEDAADDTLYHINIAKQTRLTSYVSTVSALTAPISYSNFTDTDWESVTRDNGFQIYVGDQMNKTPPTVNGVINELEYSYSKTYSSEELISPNEEKALGGVTEYIAHDADYIYYAIAVTQASDDYVLQWQFNPLNQFAIFTDRAGDATPDLKASLFQRVNLKIQYKPDGQTTHELAWNYGGMTWEKLPVVGEGKDIEYAVTKTADNLKMYEIKLSKDYLAAYNLCDKEDIKVLPYMTHQHAEATIGRLCDQSLLDTLSALGATRPKDKDLNTAIPLFMVLEESPDAIQNVIKPSTQETASARISTENTGLRFKTQISKAELQELIDKFGAENVSVGTLIAPQDKLGTSALTHEFGTVNQDYIDVKANINTPFADEDGVLTYAGSISNIKQKNLDREFTAVGYISYVDFNGDTKYIYSTDAATRSIDYVATKALEDTTKDYSLEARAILEKLTVKYYEDLVKDPFEEDPFYVAEN